MTDWYRLDSTVKNLRYGYHGQMWNPIFPFLIGMQSKFNQLILTKTMKMTNVIDLIFGNKGDH